MDTLIYKEKSLMLGGISINYVDIGEGDPILLLHGLGADMSRWQHNIGELARGHRVIALDLPGFGSSDKPESDYGGKFYIDLLLRFVAVLGVDRFSVVGNSMGGWLSMLLAKQAPKLVDKLVLVAPAFYFGLPTGVDTRAIVRTALPSDIDTMQRYLERVLYKSVPDESIPGLLAAMQQKNRAHVIHAIAQSLQNSQDVFIERDLAKIPHTTLIVHGVGDGVVSVVNSQQLAQMLPNAHVQIMARAGHWPQWERPEQFNRLLEQFFRG